MPIISSLIWGDGEGSYFKKSWLSETAEHPIFWKLQSFTNAWRSWDIKALITFLQTSGYSLLIPGKQLINIQRLCVWFQKISTAFHTSIYSSPIQIYFLQRPKTTHMQLQP